MTSARECSCQGIPYMEENQNLLEEYRPIFLQDLLEDEEQLPLIEERQDLLEKRLLKKKYQI